MTKYLITLGLLLSFLWSIGQKIEGFVRNSDTNEPIENVSIKVIDAEIGAVSDFNGTFTIAEIDNEKVKLEFRHIGYKSLIKSVNIKQDEKITIFLIPEVKMYEDIVVSATKGNIGRQNVPVSVTVLDETMIENSPESNVLPIVSQSIPGVFITQKGIAGYGLAGGSAGKISVRGVGGTGDNFPVLMLIDGQPQFMGIFGHPIPDSYASSDFERIEVIKGPASVLYGTNAMGGVINLITKKQKKQGWNFKLKGAYGSYKTASLNGSVGYRKDKFNILGSYNHLQTEGHRANSSFNMDNFLINSGYRFNDNFSFNLSASQSNFTSIDPGSIYAPDIDSYDQDSHWIDIKRTNVYAALSNHFDHLNGGVKVFYTAGDHELYTNWKSVDRNIGFSFFQNLSLFENNTIGLGIEGKNYGGKGSLIGDIWYEVNELGGYGFVQQTFFNRLILNSGLRYEHHSVYGSVLIPQFGAVYQVDNNTSIKANVSKGFRSPTIKELYLFPVANSALLPEHLWNYELSFHKKMFQNRWLLDVNLFALNAENLIMVAPNPAGTPPFLNQNSGNVANKGLELESKVKLTDYSSFKVGYSYLHMKTPVISAPVHQVNLSSDLTFDKFLVNFSENYIGGLYTRLDDRNTPDINEETTESYLLFDASVTYKLSSKIKIFVSAENIFNTQYQVQYGYPMPGISVIGGIAIDI